MSAISGLAGFEEIVAEEKYLEKSIASIKKTRQSLLKDARRFYYEKHNV